MKKLVVFVKVSGSALVQEKIHRVADKLGEWCKKAQLVVYVGGNTQISKLFDLRKIPNTFGPSGREYREISELQLAEHAIIENQGNLGRALFERQVPVRVHSPSIQNGEHGFLVDADQLTLVMYPRFKQLIVVAAAECFEAKTERFRAHKNVQIVAV